LERGVRYVQLFDAPANNAWDHHSKIRENLPRRCAAVDRPIAALLGDLKARGLLEDTLVLWGGEFGRTPTAEGADGPEHPPLRFRLWAGRGRRPPGPRPRGARRIRLARWAGQSPRPRPARADPAHHGLRSRTTDLPAWRPRLPPHRCPRPRRPANPRGMNP